MRQTRVQFHAQRMARPGFAHRRSSPAFAVRGWCVHRRYRRGTGRTASGRRSCPTAACRPTVRCDDASAPARANRAGVAKNGHKQIARFRNGAQRLFQMAARVAQLAHGGGINALDLAVAHHQVEHAHDGLRLADKQRFVAQIDQIAAQLEIVVQRARLFGGIQRGDGLVEQLQQHVVQLADAPRHAVEVFHHALDRLVAFAFIAQQLCHAELAIEQQAVVVTWQHRVQRETDAPQETLAFVQLVTLGTGEKPKPTISSSEVAPKWRRATHSRVWISRRPPGLLLISGSGYSWCRGSAGGAPAVR